MLIVFERVIVSRFYQGKNANKEGLYSQYATFSDGNSELQVQSRECDLSGLPLLTPMKVTMSVVAKVYQGDKDENGRTQSRQVLYVEGITPEQVK